MLYFHLQRALRTLLKLKQITLIHEADESVIMEPFWVNKHTHTHTHTAEEPERLSILKEKDYRSVTHAVYTRAL